MISFTVYPRSNKIITNRNSIIESLLTIQGQLPHSKEKAPKVIKPLYTSPTQRGVR
jgi:hypothetical protein